MIGPPNKTNTSTSLDGEILCRYMLTLRSEALRVFQSVDSHPRFHHRGQKNYPDTLCALGRFNRNRIPHRNALKFTKNHSRRIWTRVVNIAPMQSTAIQLARRGDSARAKLFRETRHASHSEVRRESQAPDSNPRHKLTGHRSYQDSIPGSGSCNRNRH